MNKSNYIEDIFKAMEEIDLLSEKRKKGKVESYIKGSDQSLWQVSQLFGVQLKSLKKINKGNNSDRVLLRRRFNLL